MRKWSFSFTGVRKYKRHYNTIITRAWSEWREVEEKFRASTSGRCYSCARHECTIANTISRVSRSIISRLHSYAILWRTQMREFRILIRRPDRNYLSSLCTVFCSTILIFFHISAIAYSSFCSPIKVRLQCRSFISVNWFFVFFCI